MGSARLIVTRRCLYKWRAKFDLMGPGDESVRPHTHEASCRKQVRQLQQLLAQSRNYLAGSATFFRYCWYSEGEQIISRTWKSSGASVIGNLSRASQGLE